LFLETSLPGVFAAGDVRSGSVKRCASAVGEGAMAVSFIHASFEVASSAKDVSASANQELSLTHHAGRGSP
jgi:5-carboxymethyl-2-hydroxymuconate isomerase